MKTTTGSRTGIKDTENISFWNQLLSHPWLHSVEFLVATLFITLIGDFVTNDKYGVDVLFIAVLIGIFTVMDFVFTELECVKRIRWLPNNANWNWRLKVGDGDKSYGLCSRLDWETTRLAILTDPSYVFTLYINKMVWFLSTVFQAIGIGLVVLYMLILHTVETHGLLLHNMLALWLLNGYANGLEMLFRQWLGWSIVPVMLFIAYKAFLLNNVDTAKSILEKRVADRLLTQINGKRNAMRYAEQIQIKLEYDPDGLKEYEFKNLSQEQLKKLESLWPDSIARITQKFAKHGEDNPSS